jgi:hypothetical protein
VHPWDAKRDEAQEEQDEKHPASSTEAEWGKGLKLWRVDEVFVNGRAALTIDRAERDQANPTHRTRPALAALEHLAAKGTRKEGHAPIIPTPIA